MFFEVYFNDALHLLKMIQCISLDKNTRKSECDMFVLFKNNTLQLTNKEDAGFYHFQTWCYWPSDIDYKVLHVSPEMQTIGIHIDSSILVRCLKNINRKGVSISLVRDKLLEDANGVKVVITSPNCQNSKAVEIKQTMNAVMLSSNEVAEVKEPSIEDPQIFFCLDEQDINCIKTCVALLKHTSNHLRICGSVKGTDESGELTISCGSDTVSHNIKLSGLKVVPAEEVDSQLNKPSEPKSQSRQKVSCVKTATSDMEKCLKVCDMKPNSLILGISDRNTMVTYSQVASATMVYFIPYRVDL